jgi:hypothetical protein
VTKDCELLYLAERVKEMLCKNVEWFRIGWAAENTNEILDSTTMGNSRSPG